MKEFGEYLASVTPRVQQIQKFLSEPIPENTNQITEDLKECVVFLASVNHILPFANAFLRGAEHEAWRIAEGVADARKAEVAVRVVPQRRFRDVISGMADSLYSRIDSDRSLISYAKQEIGANR